jgi:hypothetical protein
MRSSIPNSGADAAGKINGHGPLFHQHARDTRTV